jgi:hypothetical protein
MESGSAGRRWCVLEEGRKVQDANGDDSVTDSAGRACHYDAWPSATSGTATTARDAPEQHVEADDGIAGNAISSGSKSPCDTGMSRATDQPKRGLISKRKWPDLIFSSRQSSLLWKPPQMQSKHQPFTMLGADIARKQLNMFILGLMLRNMKNEVTCARRTLLIIKQIQSTNRRLVFVAHLFRFGIP